ncbi:hypothetical protein, partial [Thermoanaerobacterium aotearoense]|uniref:hypothetical protein n=1 Tax=Thermoanaerobacterium aotearoense TaxID=47490 RepID=UPI001F41F7F8
QGSLPSPLIATSSILPHYLLSVNCFFFGFFWCILSLLIEATYVNIPLLKKYINIKISLYNSK